MPKPVLLLYTANDCPPCSQFLKNTWDSVKNSVSGYVSDIVHLSQEERNGGQWNTNMPNAFKEKVTHFPSVFVVRAADWYIAQQNKDARVSSLLFPSKGDVVEWIKEAVNQASVTSSAPTGGSITKNAQPTVTSSSRPSSGLVVRRQPVIDGTENNPTTVCSLAYKIKGRK